jgi:hypothetical protein
VLGVGLGVLGAAAVGGILAVAATGHHPVAHRSAATGPGAHSAGAGSHGIAEGPRLVAGSFSAQLPPGWRITARDVAMGSYHHSAAQSPSGDTEVDIDDSALPHQSLEAHFQSVETATAATPGYELLSLADGRVAGAATITWSFALPGQTNPQRVDVFRRVGDNLYAVLGMSDSLAASRTAATAVAASLTAR